MGGEDFGGGSVPGLRRMVVHYQTAPGTGGKKRNREGVTDISGLTGKGEDRKIFPAKGKVGSGTKNGEEKGTRK